MEKTEVITRVSKLVILFLFAVTPVMLNGQDNRKVLMRSIRGTVVYAASGYPIAYASVALLGYTGIVRGI